MKRRILHSFLSLSIALFGFANLQAQSVEIFVNPSTSQNIVTGNAAYHIGEAVYLGSEVGATNFLTAGAAINHIEISVSVPGTPTSFGTFNVYLKEVTTTTLAAGTFNKTGYTQVFSGTIDLMNAGWFPIELTTPFIRTSGTKNLQILFERLDGVARTAPVTYDASVGNTTSSAAVTTRRYNGATLPVVGTTAMTTSAFRPAIRFAHVNATDAAISDLVLPASSCYSAPQNLGVVVSNVGSTTSFGVGAASVALTITGANTYSTTLTNTTSIAPGGTETITFPAISLANLGTNNIQAVVAFAGDGSTSNDTLRSTLTTTGTTSTFPVVESADTPLAHFQYVQTLSGNNAWALQTGSLANAATATTTDSLAPHGGNSFYVFDSYNVQSSDAILYSECLSLPAAGPSGNNYYVSFWMSHDTAYSTAPNVFLDSIYLVISTDKGSNLDKTCRIPKK